jgi:hypothetical protein
MWLNVVLSLLLLIRNRCILFGFVIPDVPLLPSYGYCCLVFPSSLVKHNSLHPELIVCARRVPVLAVSASRDVSQVANPVVGPVLINVIDVASREYPKLVQPSEPVAFVVFPADSNDKVPFFRQ